MKILIISDGEDLLSPMDEQFGRANYFILIDSEKDTWEVIENEIVSEHRGRHVAKQIKNLKVDAVIISHIGPAAFEILKEASIKIYLAEKMQVKKAVELFKKGNLTELNKHTGPPRKIRDLEN